MTDAVKTQRSSLTTLILTILFASMTVFAVSTVTTIKLLTKSTTLAVPDLSHKSVESARSICRVKRLKLAIQGYRFDERIPANIILDQTPEPETKIKSGRVIKVIVSRGSRSVKVPALTNMSLREASLAIENAGLHVGRVTRIFSPLDPKDQVLQQWPAPAEDLTAGEKVSLLLSRGPKPVWFLMPQLKGQHIDQAADMLEKLGLQLSEIKRKVDNTQPTGMVIAQTPPAGARVKLGLPAGLIATKRTDHETALSRYVTIRYRVPAAKRDVRVKVLASDDTGLHELYNAMEKPDSDLLIRRTLIGTSATLKIYVNGQLQEEREI